MIAARFAGVDDEEESVVPLFCKRPEDELHADAPVEEVRPLGHGKHPPFTHCSEEQGPGVGL